MHVREPEREEELQHIRKYSEEKFRVKKEIETAVFASLGFRFPKKEIAQGRRHI